MLAGLIAVALFSPQVVNGPSFDCTAAFEPVENAICTDARLARLDVHLNTRYVAVRRALSPEARRALAEDQRWFLGARDEWYENRERWSDFPDVAARMTDRIAFLDALDTRRPGGLTGRWRNLAGEVEITLAPGGRLQVSINAANPVNARWLCDVDFTGRLTGRSVEGLSDSDPAYRLKAELKGDVLHIDETRLDATAYGPGYCGANGSTAGVYFRVR